MIYRVLQINKVVHDHIVNADMSASDVAETWSLIAEEGEMRVYKQEHVDDNNVVDPVKAVHAVKGITGRELCEYFWDPSVRLEWDFSLETSKVVEWVSQDTLITYQVCGLFIVFTHLIYINSTLDVNNISYTYVHCV